MREPVAMQRAAMREGGRPAIGDQPVDRLARQPPARSVHQPEQRRHRHAVAIGADAFGEGRADLYKPGAGLPDPGLGFGKPHRCALGRRPVATGQPLDEPVGKAQRQVELDLVEGRGEIMSGAGIVKAGQRRLVLEDHHQGRAGRTDRRRHDVAGGQRIIDRVARIDDSDRRARPDEAANEPVRAPRRYRLPASALDHACKIVTISKGQQEKRQFCLRGADVDRCFAHATISIIPRLLSHRSREANRKALLSGGQIRTEQCRLCLANAAC